MRLSYVYAVLLMLATACSVQAGTQAGFDSSVDKTDTESATVVKTVMQVKESYVAVTSAVVENQEPDAKKQDEEKTDKSDAEPEKDAAKEFKALNDKMTAEMKEYSLKLRRARSAAARAAAMKSNPMIELGPKFIEFAKEYEGTKEAYSAIYAVTSRGSGEAKQEAMEMLMAMVEADPDSAKSMAALTLLVNQGIGEPKSMAMAKILATTTADPDSETSKIRLALLAFASGEDESKTQAIEQLFKSIQAKPTSDDSVDYLIRFATRGTGDAKADAMDLLIEENVNHEKMETVMMGLTRSLPSPEAHQWLKEISEKATSSKIKANAIMTRISYLDRIASFKSFLKGADEERRKAYSKEVLEFVEADRDPQELRELEEMLENFVKENQTLLKRAEKELYVLQNLSVGCEAPEIVGTDLDGVEFKLSDYRGKVVFLDFWGDW